MAIDDGVAQNLHNRTRPLGICWLIYGAVRLVAAAWLVSFLNTATLMFGALLNRVANPFSMMSCFHFIYACAVVLSMICGVFGILAGWALLADRNSARRLTLITAFLSLSDVPLGVTLGIFTLITLLPQRVGHASAARWGERPSDLRSHTSTT